MQGPGRRCLGEHTEEVLQELGYPPAEIARLREMGGVK